MEKNRCIYTGNQEVSAGVDQLAVWQRTARRQAEATSRAATAAEVIVMIWEKLDEKTRERINADPLIRERIRFVTGFYGFTCS